MPSGLEVGSAEPLTPVPSCARGTRQGGGRGGPRDGERPAWARNAWPLLLLLSLLPSALAYQAQHGSLSVVYRDARDREQLGAVYRAWTVAVRDLGALGLTPPAQVRIEAARDAADFAGRTGEPASIAASTRGPVIRTQRLSALAAGGRLPVTLRHEAFHTAQPSSLPRWLAEGLARTFSGEARADPQTPTGFERLSGPQLNAELLGRSSARLSAAYREATRRAGRRVQELGWKGALKW